MVEKAHRMLGLLEFRTPQPGEPYYTLTRKFTRILGQYNSNSVAVARFIGGIVTERNHYGDVGAVAPVQPVPFADQRRALQVLCRIVFSDTALRFSPDLLARLQQNPVPYGPLTAGAGAQDLSILDTIANVQAAGLYAVLNPGTLGRIETNEFRAAVGSQPLSVLEAINTVTATVWSDLDAPAATPARGRPPAAPPLAAHACGRPDRAGAARRGGRGDDRGRRGVRAGDSARPGGQDQRGGEAGARPGDGGAPDRDAGPHRALPARAGHRVSPSGRLDRGRSRATTTRT